MIAPQRLMAPVGSEVILVSGLVGKRGDYEPRQPIQWTLAPDGVGHLVSSNSDGECLKPLWHHTAHRRSGDEAVTFTSAAPQILTRGTANPADDYRILRGQSWITVTSPTEGATYVSVLASKAENWDQRRQTATIHWVDVQWILPPPGILESSQSHTLTTTLLRSSGKPLAGWIVRYEILPPGSTAFGPEGQTSTEVTTDESGRASVNLVPANKSSTCQVEIKIIRPSAPDDDLPRMVVGRGFTTVSWNAPDPKISLTGPEMAAVGGAAAYRADVSNAGAITARGITAHATVPANMTFLQSDPPPSRVIGNRLEWNLGDLSPGDARPIAIHCRPERNADTRFCVRVSSQDKLQGQPLEAEACVQTRVFSSALSLRIQGPETAQVGQQVRFEIVVANTGVEPLSNVVIRDRLDPGLELPDQAGSLIERALPQPLPAGNSQKIDVLLNVRQSGRLCQAVEAFADGGHTATASTCLEGTQPQAAPRLDVTIQGPLQGRVGQAVTYTMQITNAGSTPLTQIRIVNTYEPSLYPKEASKGFDLNALRRGELVWTVERLEPGQTLNRQSMYECLRAATAAWSRVTVETAEQVRVTRETTTQILPPEAAPRPPATPPAEAQAAPQEKPRDVTGELRVSIADTRDPIAINAETTYIISIENARNVSDRKLAITITLPPGLEYVRLNGPVAPRSLSPDRRTIEVTEIAEVRAGERLNPFYLEVRGTRIGKHTVQVRVDSFRSAAPVEAFEDTTVNISG